MRRFLVAAFLAAVLTGGLHPRLAPSAGAQSPGKAFKLRWFGQSFFQLETPTGKKIVFDPHAIPEFGRPVVSADVILISHLHNDHAQPEVVEGYKAARVFYGLKEKAKGRAPEVYRAMQGPNEWTTTGALKGWDTRDRLREIEVPTLVVRGRYDMCTEPVAAELVEGIPGARGVGYQRTYTRNIGISAHTITVAQRLFADRRIIRCGARRRAARRTSGPAPREHLRVRSRRRTTTASSRRAP